MLLTFLSFVMVPALPGRSQEVDRAIKGFLQPKRDSHRQVERERYGRLALGHEEIAGKPAPAKVLVERHQAMFADQQAEIDIPRLMEEVERPPDRRAGEPSPPKGRVRLDAADAAIARIIVSDPEQVEELFRENNVSFGVCELMAVELRAVATQFIKILATLLMAEVNVHFSYPLLTRPNGRAALAMHVDDSECAASVLQGEGFRLLSQRDISR